MVSCLRRCDLLVPNHQFVTLPDLTASTVVYPVYINAMSPRQLPLDMTGTLLNIFGSPFYSHSQDLSVQCTSVHLCVLFSTSQHRCLTPCRPVGSAYVFAHAIIHGLKTLLSSLHQCRISVVCNIK